jgi:hypothetical protein
MGRLLPAVLCALLLPLAGCDTVAESDEAELQPPAQLAGLGARRCPHCAWIEARREIRPQVFEYTARMADGSSRVFQETLPTRWRLGERLVVIDGSTSPL